MLLIDQLNTGSGSSSSGGGSGGGGGDVSNADVLISIMTSAKGKKRGMVGTNVFVEDFSDPGTFILKSGFYDVERERVYIP